MFSVVLVHPEIPPNTGNVIRLCANTGAALHLVEPLGFPLDDAKMRRAGLDYHEFAALSVHRDWIACRAALAATAPERWFAATTSATQFASRLAYRPGDVFVFGRETAGLPPGVLSGFPATQRIRIPMLENSRSLNLSNAVAVVVYEAWRQQGFAGAV
ncbi:MAG: tRNA (cytidine(34)-2'-O)-methyltransferase [Betaproteobacteria bacterium]|nr:tRNA (cytidine(34)-2'-O)-methyltransferase [Betaproteobacteria bacterium]